VTVVDDDWEPDSLFEPELVGDPRGQDPVLHSTAIVNESFDPARARTR